MRKKKGAADLQQFSIESRQCSTGYRLSLDFIHDYEINEYVGNK